MKIRLVQAKSILNRSKINDGYTLNPYVGCPHGCVYCYNQDFLPRIRRSPEKWGQFLDVKINAPEILAKEIIKKPKMPVFFSTVTDPFNPLEAKYQLTRRCLEALLQHQWPVTILTKSNLILRTIDLLKQFKTIEVGFTLTTLDNQFSRLIEPCASLPTERIKALAELHQAGISTYAFIAPILPQITDLAALFKNLQGKVNEIWLDSFNARGANWQGLQQILKKHYPKIEAFYQQFISPPEARLTKDGQPQQKYERELKQKIRELSQKYQIPVKICF